MKRYFTGAFFKFLFAFLIIIGVAFGVLIAASSRVAPNPVDIVAQPK